MTRVRLCCRRFRPTIEPLEDRQMLSTCQVTRLGDEGIGANTHGDLRYCIDKANQEPGPDAITFDVSGVINLKRTLPLLKSEIDIQGPGTDVLTVRRASGGNYRIFTVISGPVSISGLSIRDGIAAQTGGGIQNSGVLTIRDTIISNNETLATSAYGGGIYNTGTLTLIRSTVAENRAFSDDWAHCYVSVQGGGIFNSGRLMIVDSAIADNLADTAAYMCNNVTTFGGGIFNTGVLGITNSTVAANGAVNQSLDYGWGEGGGLYNSTHGTAVLRQSTVAQNYTGYGVTNGFGGGGVANHGTLHVWNTIIAKNLGCDWICFSDPSDLHGSLTTSGYNLIGNTSGGSGFAPTDILNANPMLGPLQNNGGPTQTLALLPGSPAIDAGDPGPDNAPEWDQRGPGFPRIVNGTIDIGAFEVQATEAPASGANGVSADIVAALTTATFDEDELW